MIKQLTPYRCPKTVSQLAEQINALVSQRWTIMEVCGGQTNSIIKHGLDQLLAPSVTFIHGPGCPVCVTPSETLSQAITLAQRPNTILCTFGDMLRVPTDAQEQVQSLLAAKALGGKVQVIYSPEEAVALAEAEPNKDIVLFAVGFETTTPATAIAALQAQTKNLKNFFMLIAHVQVPPALYALISTPEHSIDAFLAAGHVCTIMGAHTYPAIAEQGNLPIVITGFEPVDILQGVLAAVMQLEKGEAHLENKYPRYVNTEGNRAAQTIINRVYMPANQNWRGLGEIENSGWTLQPEFKHFDAQQLLSEEKTKIYQGLSLHGEQSITSTASSTDYEKQPSQKIPDCQAGTVLTGKLKPCDCPHFGNLCQPQHPLGAPMVSDEGACATYFRYREPEITDESPPTMTVTDLLNA